MRPLPHALSFTQRVISSFLCNEEGKYNVVLHIVAHQMLFFPLISTQGRENDQQTHTHTHTHTLVARTSESDCSSHPRSPWIPVVLIWLMWLGFMFTVNQNAQQTQGHRVLQRIQQRRQSSLHSDEVMTYRALHWYLISPKCIAAVLCYCLYTLYTIVLINILNYLFFFFFFFFLVCLVILCVVFMYIYVKKCFYNFCCALFIVLLFCFLSIYTFVYILLVVIFVILNTFVFLIIFLCLKFWFVF